MSRENGHYWVKPRHDYGKPEVAEFIAGEWWIYGECLGSCDGCFYEINPTRILTPDEQEEKELNEALQSKADMAHQEYLDDC